MPVATVLLRRVLPTTVDLNIVARAKDIGDGVASQCFDLLVWLVGSLRPQAVAKAGQFPISGRGRVQ